MRARPGRPAAPDAPAGQFHAPAGDHRRVRGLLRDDPGLPVGRVRRQHPAEAEELPGQRRFPERKQPGAQCRRAHQRRQRRPRGRQESRGAQHDEVTFDLPPNTRRFRSMPTRCSARRPRSARSTSTSRLATPQGQAPRGGSDRRGADLAQRRARRDLPRVRSQTRTALRRWFQEQAAGLQGRGRDLSDALGNTAGVRQDTNQLLRSSTRRRARSSELVSNTGEVFDALSERRGQLRGSIKNWNTVLATIARRNKEIEGTFKALPTFAKEGSAAMVRLGAFGRRPNPGHHASCGRCTRPRPDGRSRSTTSRPTSTRSCATSARWSTPRRRACRPAGGSSTSAAGSRGVPAGADGAQPVLRLLAAHRDDFMAFIVNVTAATQASSVPPARTTPVHYLRAMIPLGPGSLATYDERQGWSRANAYALSELSPRPASRSTTAVAARTAAGRRSSRPRSRASASTSSTASSASRSTTARAPRRPACRRSAAPRPSTTSFHPTPDPTNPRGEQ